MKNLILIILVFVSWMISSCGYQGVYYRGRDPRQYHFGKGHGYNGKYRGAGHRYNWEAHRHRHDR